MSEAMLGWEQGTLPSEEALRLLLKAELKPRASCSSMCVSRFNT